MSVASIPEIEFSAQDELIAILPNFKMDALNLVSGTFGPFEPQQPVNVPIWLALMLRKERKCGIITPEWLDHDSLRTKEDEERSDEKSFTKVPFHFQVVASMLLRTAKSDVKDARKVQTLLNSIADLRAGKIKAGLKMIKSKVDFVKLNNISSIELYSIRDFVVKTLNVFKTLAGAVDLDADEYESQQNRTQMSQSQSQL